MDRIATAPELAVALGGGIDANGGPTPSTGARAHRAAQLARERPELALICSGAGPEGTAAGMPSEATLMRDLVITAGIASERVALEDESLDTLGNAVLVAVRYLQDIEPRPLSLITSPFHLERATETFRHVLGYRWQILAVAADETPDDVARAPRETRYLQETSVFFAGVRPGDLRSIIQRLRERSPAYAGLTRLQLD